MKIQFHGAVRTVTGSLHIIETARGELVLLDCGMFQGRRAESRERNTKFPIDPRRVKALVLSHAHIDHIGNLPTWVSKGLNCPVFCTSATQELGGLMLRDSANIQEHDAAYLNKHNKLGTLHGGKQGEEIQPLYSIEHADRAIKLLQGKPYKEWFEVRPGLRAIFHDAGHILGSASISLEETHEGIKKRLVFTGDIGRPNSPILRDPEPPTSGADVVISESTYGDRDHPPQAELEDGLVATLEKTFARKGKVLIPAFALGRTQALLFALRELQRKNRLPVVPVYVDSPLACGATDVFLHHPECYDTQANKVNQLDGSLFAVEGYSCLRAANDSKALNRMKGPALIIAASGMCEAGRILHHLSHGLEDANNTVLIVGYQAENTLGRKLVEGWKEVRVFGWERKVNAEVKVLNGFSAHAGQSEMRGYLEHCRPAGPVFLVHGDLKKSEAFQTHLHGNGFPDVRIPTVGETFKV